MYWKNVCTEKLLNGFREILGHVEHGQRTIGKLQLKFMLNKQANNAKIYKLKIFVFHAFKQMSMTSL